MSGKRALIVDDSKSARVVLGRMLQKYGIEVDTAESAEAAIEYLKHSRPDVIFMDHLMPGMDGFEAVQAIKSNPDTATIPIMMYTSQQGELYAGQARALGAVGVLPKLVKPVDVSKVLYQLRLLPERRDLSPPAFVEASPQPASSQGESAVRAAANGLMPADWHEQLQAALRAHDSELRRFMLVKLEEFNERVGKQVDELGERLRAQSPEPARVPAVLWAAVVLLALLPGLVLGWFHLRAVEDNRRLAAALTLAEQNSASLAQALQQLNERQQAAEAHPAAMQPAQDPSLPPEDVLIEPVAYGETPLSGRRVEVLRELIARLRERAFDGVLSVEVFAGQFCLVGNPTEGYSLAPANVPVRECSLIGNPYLQGLTTAQYQSVAFANLVTSVRGEEGALEVRIGQGGEKLLEPYPDGIATLTAGEWNEIAARNNRVEFRAIPAVAPAG